MELAMNITADRTDSIEMSSNILTPEQFVEIVKNDESIKEALFQHKRKFDELGGIMIEAKKVMKETVQYGTGFYARISKLIKILFPDIEFFSDEHEAFLLDYIFIDVYGWKPNDHNFWYFDINTKDHRAHALAFQKNNRPLGSKIVEIVKKVKKDRLKSRLSDLYNLGMLNIPSSSSNEFAQKDQRLLLHQNSGQKGFSSSTSSESVQDASSEAVQEYEESDIFLIHQKIGGFQRLLDDNDESFDINPVVIYFQLISP